MLDTPTEGDAMTTSENPMFLRQRLRDRLKKARETAGLTQQQVADAFGWSPSKVIRIENGKIGVSITDAMALVSKYGIDPDDGRQLVDLAKAARRPSWYAPYRPVMTPQLEVFVAYEESASIVRAFECNMVPGLIQTEEYARALMIGFEAEGGPRRVPGNLELSVELRMRRQRVLETENTEFYFILDEAALRRTIGDETIMRQQYEALLRLNDLPNVNIFYVPFSVGIYPFFRTPYSLFAFSDSDDSLVAYIETPAGQELLNEKTPKSTSKLEPEDYLDGFWKVEKNFAKEISEDVLMALA